MAVGPVPVIVLGCNHLKFRAGFRVVADNFGLERPNRERAHQ